MEPLRLSFPLTRLSRSGKQDGTPPVSLGSVAAGSSIISPMSGPAMEIAHILFLDVVGYSKLRTTQQADVQRELQTQLQAAGEVTQGRQQGKLIIRPTGDGAALIFLRDMLSPLRCAIQIQTLLRHNDAEIRQRIGTSILLRMGVHSGPVILSTDLNSQSEVAGEGINMAQRVMDCGDAGHILLSADYAEKLRAIDPWPRYLQDIGEFTVKHGAIVHLYNFYGKFDGIPCGMPGKPKRLREAEATASGNTNARGPARFDPAKRLWIIGGCLLVMLVGGGMGIWNNDPKARKTLTQTFQQLTAPRTVAAAEKTEKSVDKKPKSGGKKSVARTKSTPQPVRQVRPVEAGVAPALETTAPPDKVYVPSFLGKTLDEAVGLAEERGIKVVRSVNSTYNSDYEEGQIYQQSTASGSAAKTGQSVYVCVSKGDAPPDKPASSTP